MLKIRRNKGLFSTIQQLTTKFDKKKLEEQKEAERKQEELLKAQQLQKEQQMKADFLAVQNKVAKQSNQLDYLGKTTQLRLP